MSADVKINADISVKEKVWHGWKVLSFSDIDAIHRKKPGTASSRFRNNESRLIHGLDFFRLNEKSDYLKAGLNQPGTLVTESGYLFLSKAFDDDFDWKVQRSVVSNYFRSKEELRDEKETQQRQQTILECARILSGCNEASICKTFEILKMVLPEIIPVAEESAGPEPEPKKPEQKTEDERIWMFNRNKLGKLVESTGLTRRELGVKMGVDGTSLTRWIRGDYPPNRPSLIKICNYFNVQPNYFDK